MRQSSVRINILCDVVSVDGLEWVVSALLQTLGPSKSGPYFASAPSRVVAVAVYRTWMALGLNPAGAHNMLVHINSDLMLHPPVTLAEMKALWAAFPPDSPILLVMGFDFVRGFMNDAYSAEELATMRVWYVDTPERKKFFKGLQDRFPRAEMQQALAEGSETRVGTVQRNPIKGRKRANSQPPKEDQADQVKGNDGMSTVRGRSSGESSRSADTVIWNPQASSSEASQRYAERARTPGPGESSDNNIPRVSGSEQKHRQKRAKRERF
ncbi:hypothetical protein IQ07DRAFT_167204 [Pyrenochaeta sp. DS3sAY3a]|nr:hypothetical protein IQ07DRAFT_167204 [Pyrenochaeta sp. DS3sAY3a]